MPNPKAVIFGCDGQSLSDDEKAFFTECQPLGFILFARNIDSPEQVKALIDELKATVSHRHVPVLVDQEGGRVARLRPPHWHAYPAAEIFGELAKKDSVSAERACYLNARLMALELSELGFNVNCAPMVDLRLEGMHDIVGDRSFGETAQAIVPLARAQANGLMDGGVVPVVKHIPGHGRARADSHIELPVVDEPLELLQKTDFEPFKGLCDLPMAMTAHIVYSAIDAEHSATMSPECIRVIRDDIGFKGLLMSDDIGMKALQGEMGDLASQCIEAGCDVALHCNGDLVERRAVAAKIPEMSDVAFKRSNDAFEQLPSPTDAVKNTLVVELTALLGDGGHDAKDLKDPTDYASLQPEFRKEG